MILLWISLRWEFRSAGASKLMPQKLQGHFGATCSSSSSSSDSSSDSHWWLGAITSPQHSHFSSLGTSFTGELLREVASKWDLRFSVLCAFPMCYFSLLSVPKVLSEMLHLGLTSGWNSFSGVCSLEVSSGRSSFFCRNSSFLLWLLFIWDGLSFFFFFSTPLGVVSLESKEKEKLPSLMESL